MSWRIERQRRRGSPITFRLRTGRGEARRSVYLGSVHPDDAAQARDAMHAIEAASLGDLWAEWHRRDIDGAVGALRHKDPVGETRRLGRDWAGMRLRDYWTVEYSPARATTSKSWEQELRSWPRILEGIGDVRVRDVDPWIVADYLDEVRVTRGRRKGLPMSGNSRRIHRAMIRALLKHAHRKKHILTVPDLATFMLKGATKKVTPPPVPLDAREARALIAAALDPRTAALFAVAIGQGLRPSELVRLDWSDVHWPIPALDIVGDDDGEGKTEASTATIPITPIALPHLRTWWVAAGQPVGGLIFCNVHGQPYASSTGWRRALVTACRRAGIGRHVTPYSLRSSFATIAWAAGVPKDVARRILRHTDSRMLDEVYERPTPQQLADKVAGFTL